MKMLVSLKENTQAPDFELSDQNGKRVKLTDLKKSWVLVYFYPKDDTSGCAKEACGLQSHLKELEKLNLRVLGISPDSVLSHQKFAKKYALSFSLLADENKDVVKLYGVWGKKQFMGKEYMGVNRSSFLIDDKGVIVKIYAKVKPELHAKEVLNDLSQLQK